MLTLTGSPARCSTGGSPARVPPFSAIPRSVLIQRRIDVDLFVVSLHRLHTVARLAAEVADPENVLPEALERFSGLTAGLPLSESEPDGLATIEASGTPSSTGRTWLSGAASGWPAERTDGGSATATVCSRPGNCRRGIRYPPQQLAQRAQEVVHLLRRVHHHRQDNRRDRSASR
jgi:hypothetical protein